MNKITVTLYGLRCIIDANQYKKHLEKEQLIATMLGLQEMYEEIVDPVCKALVMDSLITRQDQLVKLNRSIRKNVQYI